MSTSSEISKFITKAEKIAEKEIIRLARRHLKSHPKLKHFYIAMGTYFFTNQNNDTIHNCNCKSLDNFISKWNEQLYLTGNPMMFTATGKIIRDW